MLTPNKASLPVSLLIFFALISIITLTEQSQRPDKQTQFTIAGESFITQNAWQHLHNITQQPHYTGSGAATHVRDYLYTNLQQMGLEVEIQNELALSSKRYTAAKVSNVIGKLKANSQQPNDKALALVSHYDSSSFSSMGASDAGSGVVVILEAIRSLIASKEIFDNDIYVIFTDAEEQGLLGAEAFVRNHPLAKNVGLVLNFEARGSGGPSYMLMETNQGNQAMIEAFSQAGIRYPAANSLMYSIYKMLPNDTDLTVFREQGDINGFNFAFIGDHFDYHTQQDTPQRLDPETLNHQIDYLTALLPYLMNKDLSTLEAQNDHVYFNFANLGIYHYPFSWVLPMAIFVAFGLLMMVVNGIKQGTLTLKHMSLGFIPIVFSLFIGFGSAWGVWHVLLAIYPQLDQSPQGFPYAGYYIIGFTLVCTLLLNIAGLIWLKKRFATTSLAQWYVATAIVWVVLNLLLAIYLTGAGFFILTAIGAVAVLGNLLRNHSNVNRQVIVITLLCLPALIVISPQIATFVVGLGMDSLALATILSSLLLLFISPLLYLLKGIRGLWVVSLAVALFLATGIHKEAAYSPNNKKASGVNYLYDTESQQAYLFTYQTTLDEFTSQLFQAQDTNISMMQEIFPISNWRKPRFVKATPSLPLPPVNYQAQQIQHANKETEVTIKITPNRALQRLQLTSSAPVTINYMSINGQTFSVKNRRLRAGYLARYVVTDDQEIEFNFRYTADQAVTFRIHEIAHDLPQQWAAFPRRPEHIMPTPFKLSDTTMISQPVVF